MKNVYLFDLDGTLTDPKEGITKSVHYALCKLGIESNPDDLVCFIGPPLKQSFSEFYGFDDEKCDLAIKYYRERYADVGLFENRLFDEVIPVLEALGKKDVKIGMATCKPEVFAKRLCDEYGITKYFDAICGTELSGTSTSKTEVIDKALRALSASAGEAVMIGDRKHDIEGAKNHHMSSVGVTFGYAKDGELEAAGADYIIDSLKELIYMDIV